MNELDEGLVYIQVTRGVAERDFRLYFNRRVRINGTIPRAGPTSPT